MKKLIFISAYCLLLIFFCQPAMAQAKLHVAGKIRSDSLAGAQVRVVMANQDGDLVTDDEADTMRVKTIQLIDDNGEVRLEMDANTGTFRMLDNDTTFYSVTVESPPEILSTYQDGAVVDAKITDPDDIRTVLNQLANVFGQEEIESRILDCFPNETFTDATPLVMSVTMASFDIGILGEIGQPPLSPYVGSVLIKDNTTGKITTITFSHEPVSGKNLSLEIPEKNLKFTRNEELDPPAAVSVPLSGSDGESTGTGTSQRFNATDGTNSFAFNEGILNLAGVTKFGTNLTQQDNASGETKKAKFNSDEMDLEDSETNSSTNATPGKLEISVGDITSTLDELGLEINDGMTDTEFFLSIFGIYKFEAGGSAGISIDAINGKIIIEGDLDINGILSKLAGTFKIDHPLDPTNKWLYHSFVESPDMMNIYNGNITTDGSGEAIVELPDYFGALNMEFRYQLTVIGSFAQAIISEEIQNNRFKIKTDKPNVKVSWQVTGIRNDSFAQDNRIQAEVEKTGWDRGKLRYDPNRKKPYSKDLQKHWERHQETLREGQE